MPLRLRGGGCSGSKAAQEDNPFRPPAPPPAEPAAASPAKGADANPFRPAPLPPEPAEPQPSDGENPFRPAAAAPPPTPPKEERGSRARPSVGFPSAATRAEPARAKPKAEEGDAPSSMLSFFSNPDKAHDKKLAGVQLDPGVTNAKEALRALRDAASATAKFYSKFADPKKGRGRWALTLPELADWSRHEAFCGGADAAAEVWKASAQLAAIDQLAVRMREAVEEEAAAELREAARGCSHGLQQLYAFELQVREATQAHEHATKSLRKAVAGLEAAHGEEAKAAKLKDVAKQQAALLAAQKKVVAAEAEKKLWEEGVAAASEKLANLAGEQTALAVAAASKARVEAETEHVGAACDALGKAYDSFATCCAEVRDGVRQVFNYEPAVKAKAPKEKGDAFHALTAQWAFGRQRCDASLKQLADFRKHGVDTALAPKGERVKLAALADACITPQLASQLHSVPLSPRALAASRSAMTEAIDAIAAELAAFSEVLKAHAAEVAEYIKLEKALKGTSGKIRDVEKDIAKLQSKGGAVEKKTAELSALNAEAEQQKARLEAMGAGIEAVGAALKARDGDKSLTAYVAVPLASFLNKYASACTARTSDDREGGEHSPGVGHEEEEEEDEEAEAEEGDEGHAAAHPDATHNPFDAPSDMSPILETAEIGVMLPFDAAGKSPIDPWGSLPQDAEDHANDGSDEQGDQEQEAAEDVAEEKNTSERPPSAGAPDAELAAPGLGEDETASAARSLEQQGAEQDELHDGPRSPSRTSASQEAAATPPAPVSSNPFE